MLLSKTGVRSGLLLVCDAVVVGLLPVAWLLRKLLLPFVRERRISIWTGSPILTVAKNCRAERLLGFQSISLVKASYYITDEFDFNLTRLARGSRLLAFCLSYVAFLAVLALAVHVHAYVDGGVLPSRRRRYFNSVELLAYRLFRIHLMVWSYGADVRTREVTLKLGEPNCCTDCTQIGAACICSTVQGRENYARVAKNATAVFSMGDMVEYTPGSRNDLFFWPVDLDAQDGKRYQPAYPVCNGNCPIRVVHAPNHREFKGTKYLEEAIAALREEGVPIELVLVERLSNEQALEIYRSADIVFDQCLIGFHGYFALEAMALGKPVMCFIRKPEEYLLHPQECPIINTHVMTLKEDLRRLVARRDELGEIGRRGRRYVEKYFSLEAFAGRLKRAYRELGVLE
jgi:glycosyltransferase involved in cell wall biosynthesis